jgi:hypothetical protein
MKLYKSTHEETKTKTKTNLPGDSKTIQSVSEYFLDLFFTLPPNISEAVSHFGNGACLVFFHVVIDHSK